MKTALPVLIMTLAALTLSGCIVSEPPEVQETEEVEEETPVVLPVTTAINGNVGTSFATPAVSFNNGDSYSTTLPRGDNTTGYVLELTWTPTLPSHETLDLWIRDARAGTVPPGSAQEATPVPPAAKASGTSPLRLAVAADLLPEIEHNILVRAGGPAGIVNGQPFTLRLAQFEDLAFDPEFVFDAQTGNA